MCNVYALSSQENLLLPRCSSIQWEHCNKGESFLKCFESKSYCLIPCQDIVVSCYARLESVNNIIPTCYSNSNRMLCSVVNAQLNRPTMYFLQRSVLC